VRSGPITCLPNPLPPLPHSPSSPLAPPSLPHHHTFTHLPPSARLPFCAFGYKPCVRAPQPASQLSHCVPSACSRRHMVVAPSLALSNWHPCTLTHPLPWPPRLLARPPGPQPSLHPSPRSSPLAPRPSPLASSLPLFRLYSLSTESAIDPVPSPTHAGGLFTVNKEFFYSIGAYDTEFGAD